MFTRLFMPHTEKTSPVHTSFTAPVTSYQLLVVDDKWRDEDKAAEREDGRVGWNSSAGVVAVGDMHRPN